MPKKGDLGFSKKVCYFSQFKRCTKTKKLQNAIIYLVSLRDLVLRAVLHFCGHADHLVLGFFQMKMKNHFYDGVKFVFVIIYFLGSKPVT